MYYKSSILINCILLTFMCLVNVQSTLMASEDYRNRRNNMNREERTNRPPTSNSESEPNENLLLPNLEETTSPIENNDVFGVIFDNKMLYTVNTKGKYSKKQLLDSDLSDINFFKKYENLKSVIFCNFNFTEVNIEYIKDYLSNELKILAIDNCSFEKNTIDVLAQILTTHNKISSLKLKSSFNNTNIEKILQSVSNHKKLKYFDIVLTEVNPEIVQKLATIIKNSSKLESFLLHCDKFSQDSSKTMQFFKINKQLKGIKNFKELVIDIKDINTNIVDDIFKCCANLKALESLSLYFGNIYDTLEQEVYDKIKILSNALFTLKTLKKITISNTNLREKEMYLILDTINKEYADLLLLDISGNKLGDNSLKTLCDVLKNNASIQTLNLGMCDIGKSTQSLPAFLTSLGSLKNLQNLYLQANSLEKMPTLFIPIEGNFFVNLSDNSISYDDVISFMQTPDQNLEAKDDSSNKRVVIFNFQNNTPINKLKTIDLIGYRKKLELLRMKKPYYFFGI